MKPPGTFRTVALVGVAGVALILAGCTLGPHYHRPQIEQPERWSAASGDSPYQATTEAQAALAQWWQQFNDAELNTLVNAALQDNLDIQTAAARIAQARAQRDVVAGALWPSVSGAARTYHFGVPSDVQNLPQQLSSEVPQAGTAASTIRIPSYLNIYQLGFDASWELDLFGQTRRAVEAANASTQAAVAARRGVIVSTLAELGNDYMQLRGTQMRLQIAQHTVELEQTLLELTQSRHNAGMASDLDVAQSQAQLQLSQAALAPLRSQILQSIHAMAVLLGRLPESMEQELSTPGAMPATPPAIPIGLPSQVLQNRPDIQQAERELAAATAAVGQAEAERFPSISLTGGTDLVSTQLNQLLHRGAWSWDVGASLTAPIFEGGRLAANQRAAQAAADQSVLQYRHTVLQAFGETEDALQNFQAASQQQEALAAAAQSQQVALDRATDVYRAGLGNFIDVLDADRSVASTRDQQAQSEEQRLASLVAIYKALGGGWQTQEAGQP
jgi:outer membrane protein, multidrug efflux system